MLPETRTQYTIASLLCSVLAVLLGLVGLVFHVMVASVVSVPCALCGWVLLAVAALTPYPEKEDAQ